MTLTSGAGHIVEFCSTISVKTIKLFVFEKETLTKTKQVAFFGTGKFYENTKVWQLVDSKWEDIPSKVGF